MTSFFGKTKSIVLVRMLPSLGASAAGVVSGAAEEARAGAADDVNGAAEELSGAADDVSGAATVERGCAGLDMGTAVRFVIGFTAFGAAALAG